MGKKKILQNIEDNLHSRPSKKKNPTKKKKKNGVGFISESDNQASELPEHLLLLSLLVLWGVCFGGHSCIVGTAEKMILRSVMHNFKSDVAGSMILSQFICCFVYCVRIA